jgi:hypothetical protein
MQDIEQTITKRIIAKALAAGYVVSVNDGEEWVINKSSDEPAIVAALFSTDMDVLRFHRPSGERIGSVCLIYGNGEDAVSDHTDNAKTTALVEGE